MYNGVERRKYKRVKKPFIISFQIREPGAPAKKYGWDIVAALDIGAGGMLFYYNKRFSVGTELDLKINYSVDKDPLICSGKVIRSLPTPTDMLYFIAVVFADIADADRKALNDTIEIFHAGDHVKG
ncbi:MAG TPA: PilZ domain-containing protein [Candidatus Omnitrophota bacterium]|nr:PilZ domain-containing protein [Candidatus Omnitrophota bacterium]HPS20640.1 PilZ domain-containing protein [Candidatus Omnitrophota bacterium]